MDRAQEGNNNEPTGEESGQYLWLAGALVGGFLILMVIILIGIILWKFVKNQSRSQDQTWAGPSPLADGNIPEERNFMNSDILGRYRSLSHISISPIISNANNTEQDFHCVMGGEMNQEHFEEDENAKTLTTIVPVVPAAPSKNASLVSEDKMLSRNPDGKMFPPPPLDVPQEFPLPPPPSTFPEQDMQDNHLQTSPEMNTHNYANSIHETNHYPKSDMDVQHITNNLDDQLLPPPPLDVPQELPLPPPPSTFPEQDVNDNHLQTFPEMNSHQQDENRIPEPNHPPKSDMDALHITKNLDDQILPPPPPDF